MWQSISASPPENTQVPERRCRKGLEVPQKKPIPLAPILLTCALLGLGCYWFWSGAQRNGAPAGLAELSPPGPATLRVAVWDLGGSAEMDLASRFGWDAAARAASATPDVIVLQSLSARAQAHALAAELGADWQVEVVPRAEGAERFLAILVHPGLQMRRWNLLDTHAAGFALMAELQTARGATVQIISAWAHPAQVEPGRAYLDWIARWCQQHPSSAVMLAGTIGVGLPAPDATGGSGGTSSPRRMPVGFAQVQPISASAGQRAPFNPIGAQMLISPATLDVQQAVLLDVQRGSAESGVPLVVDFHLP